MYILVFHDNTNIISLEVNKERSCIFMNNEDKNFSSERPVPEIPQSDTEHTHEPEKSENINK